MSAEEWRPIKGYEGLYEVSSHGRVRSFKKNKWGITAYPKVLKGQMGKNYRTVSLCNDTSKKTVPIHRLVAETFIPTVEGRHEVNHKDGNKLNNSASNLEWVTHKRNMTHASKTGLLGCSKATICVETGCRFDSITDAAKNEGVSQGQMSKAIKLNKSINGHHYKTEEVSQL